jgi:putative transposase
VAANEPIDPRVRLAISQWPEDAPRGAVSTFCAEHGISRKSFYELRRRTRFDGPAAVLEPRSRRPRSSPSKLTGEVKAQALDVRSALEQSGLDYGPISVHDKMRAMGLEVVPSVTSLARIFREAGVARLEPKKRPRAAWRRFVYPAPNACWQLDATEYVMTGGRKCVIFQLIDDHSRYAVASHAAWGETAKDAIKVFNRAVAAHGVPQRLLSDNGIALNPSRRGIVGQLVAHVADLGVEAITGKPYKPSTQGKNERFHQTLFRYPRQATTGRVVGRAPRPGRRVRRHLQHRASSPRATRTHHTADGLAGHAQGRSAATEAGATHLRAAGPRPSTPTQAARGPTHRHRGQNREHRRHHRSE